MKSHCLFLVAFFIFSSCQRNQIANYERPNIIFILTDDQRWDALGYAGNDIIKTPEMDRLAEEGTYFKNAFVTTPICAASRASILTGLYERTHGYTFQQGPLKDAYMQLSYPVLLRQNGYFTGFFGKFGILFDKADTLFDQAEIYDRNNMAPNRNGYFYKTIDKDTVHLTQYTGNQAREFIKTAPPDKPFCLSLSFSAPHAHDSAPEQYIWQEKSDILYDEINIPPPLLGEDSCFDNLPPEVRAGFNRLRWHWRYDTPEKYQHSVKGYYRMITEIDDELGEIRKLLKERGIADNTVIILMGDNGYYMGERQLAGKWLMHDNSLRVPLIINDPRNASTDDIEKMVLNIDIANTILNLADTEIPKEYQGISLLPYTSNRTPSIVRDTIMIEHLWNLVQIPSSEGIRTDQWKYFRYRFIEAPEELYNLESDPLESNNLALDPEYQAILNNLRNALEAKSSICTEAKLVPDLTPGVEIDMSF